MSFRIADGIMWASGVDFSGRRSLPISFCPRLILALRWHRCFSSGENYTVVRHYTLPGSDLRIVEVAETFPYW